MKQATNIKEFKAFNCDIKKMTDAELEASLKELREFTMTIKSENLQPQFRRRVA